MKGWEWVIFLVLCVFFIFTLLFAYFLQKTVFNAMNNPQKIQSLIIQLTSLRSDFNKELGIHFIATFKAYIQQLIEERKMTLVQAQNLLTNATSSAITFFELYSSKVIDWKYFIENYYYKNDPSLEIVPPSQIPTD